MSEFIGPRPHPTEVAIHHRPVEVVKDVGAVAVAVLGTAAFEATLGVINIANHFKRPAA